MLPTAPTFLIDERIYPPTVCLLRYRSGRGVAAQLVHELFHLARFHTPPDPSALVSGVVWSTRAGIEIIAMNQLRDPLFDAVTHSVHPSLDPALRAETQSLLRQGAEPSDRSGSAVGTGTGRSD